MARSSGGTIEEARAHRFAVVFLPGLAEGIFPRRAYEDPLLLDHYRIKLEQPIARRDQLVARERLLLSVAAAAADTRLVVSYPRMDTAQSRPRVPSFYALKLRAPPRGLCLSCVDSRSAPHARPRRGSGGRRRRIRSNRSTTPSTISLRFAASKSSRRISAAAWGGIYSK
jgi:hypothetical protein